MHCINTRSYTILFHPKRTTFRVCATFWAFFFAHDPRESGECKRNILSFTFSLAVRICSHFLYVLMLWCCDWCWYALAPCISLSQHSLSILCLLSHRGIGHAACHVMSLHKQHPFVHFNCTVSSQEHPVHNNNNKYIWKNMLKLLIHRSRTQTECSIRTHNQLLKWNLRRKSSRSRSLLISF